MGTKATPTSISLDDTTKQRLADLVEELGKNRSEVVRVAVRRLHRRYFPGEEIK